MFAKILFFLFIPTICFADIGGTQFDVINDFSKGLNSHSSPYLTPDNSAVSLQNVDINKYSGYFSQRAPLASYLSYGSNPINGLYRYYNTSGLQFNVVALSTNLMTDSSGSKITLNNEMTTGKTWQFINYQNILIGDDGQDNVQKWDGVTQTTADTTGSRAANALTADLGAPFVVQYTGGSLTASKWYKYRMGFYDGTTYYYSTARSNTIETGAATCLQFQLTNIPLGSTSITTRYIYRTNGDSSKANAEADTTYYLIKVISDNSTTTYIDNIADSSGLTPSWATVSAGVNVTPPVATMFEINAGRIFSAGNPTNPSYLNFSDGNGFQFWPVSNFLNIRANDGDVITFVKNNLGVLIVGKNNSIQKAYTQGATSSWQVSDPFSTIGSPAPLSAQKTPVGIIYLGRDGLYLFDGNNSKKISDPVTEEINDILQSNFGQTVGIYANSQYRLAYTSAATGSTNNNRVLVYDFNRDAFELDIENINAFAYLNSGTDTGIIYAGSSISDGYVFELVSSPLNYGVLTNNQQSQLDAGTYTDTSSFLSADPSDPVLSNGWSCTIGTWLANLQSHNASINTIQDILTYLPNATIQSPTESGTWVSPVYQINAKSLDRIYWNETLGPYGTATFQVRTGAVSVPDGSWTSWSSGVTNPNGSDISGTGGNTYIQVEITLATSSNLQYPQLFKSGGYLFQIGYLPIGANYETSVYTVWQTGFRNFTKGSQYEGNMKLITRIKVFYQGTSGILNFNIMNDDGTYNQTFTVDLSQIPSSDTTNQYTESGNYKIFTFIPPMATSSISKPIGQYFQYLITETGTIPFTIEKIETAYSIQELINT
jgi:hypothetical protein